MHQRSIRGASCHQSKRTSYNVHARVASSNTAYNQIAARRRANSKPATTSKPMPASR